MDAVIEYVPVKQNATVANDQVGQVKPSQAYNAVHFVRYALMAVALMWAYAVVPWELHWGFLAVPLTLILLRAVYRWIDVACLSYRFEGGERVVWSWGVLSRNTGSLEVFRVQTVTMHQTFFERMAGVGTVILETRDPTNPVVRLLGMPKPEALRASLTEYVQRARRARGVQEAAVN